MYGETTYDDLKMAVKESLDSRGVLADLKARLRAEIFKTIQDKGQRPAPAFETAVVNELIAEYLNYNGYSHSLSVFKAEVNGVSKPNRSREDVAMDLKIDLSTYPPEM
ncbi:hypothetical protein HDU67_008480 [Dinochytrium kinnereticum]|nr:hypothetical protein HDU67_008480 [Dinochytrium kinnereticum]